MALHCPSTATAMPGTTLPADRYFSGAGAPRCPNAVRLAGAATPGVSSLAEHHHGRDRAVGGGRDVPGRAIVLRRRGRRRTGRKPQRGDRNTDGEWIRTKHGAIVSVPVIVPAMAGPSTDTGFAGSIPQLYDTHLVAADLRALRAATSRSALATRSAFARARDRRRHRRRDARAGAGAAADARRSSRPT